MAIGIIVIGSELCRAKDGDYRETELGVRAAPQAAQLAQSWLRDAPGEAGFSFKEGGR